MNKKECSNNYNNFKFIIENVKEEIVDLTWMQEVWMYPVFDSVLKNPECNIQNVLDYIDQNPSDDLGIQISLLGLRDLSYGSTLFVTEELIRRGIDEKFMAYWIVGEYGNRNLIKFKHKSEVVGLIQGLNPQTESLRKTKEFMLGD